MSIETAVWRPAPERHNIWEQIVHTAYWKYSVWRRIAGADKGSFPLEGSDWFPRTEEHTATDLKADIRLLKEQHEALMAAVEKLTDKDLERTPQGSTSTFAFLITGAAAHDVYHAGQIQLLKRMCNRS